MLRGFLFMSLFLHIAEAGESSANHYDINDKTQYLLCLMFSFVPGFLHLSVRKQKAPAYSAGEGGHTKMDGASSICDETIKLPEFPLLVSAWRTSGQSEQYPQR